MNDMTRNDLTAKQADILDKILALRALTKRNGILTHRSQNEILATLSATDLAVVAQRLQE